MRAWLLAAIWGASFSLVAACGDAEADFEDDATQAGQATAGTAGAAGSAGSASGGSASGGSASGGSASGGSASGGSASGAGSSGGGAAEAGASGSGASGGGEGALVDCDPRKITCKRAAPVCGAMEVPSVEGSCYGECVKIERCACDAPAACPNPNEFTCWNNAQHCGPFVQ